MAERILSVLRIEGEYAILRNAEGEELFIALSLLPLGADIGTRLRLNGTELIPIDE